jgi:hypothetical protein
MTAPVQTPATLFVGREREFALLRAALAAAIAGHGRAVPLAGHRQDPDGRGTRASGQRAKRHGSLGPLLGGGGRAGVLARIPERERALLDFLAHSRTLEKMIAHRFIYPPHATLPRIDACEKRSIEQDLERLILQGHVERDEGSGYWAVPSR